jgi:quercetin dioxygenase-like cupin family protein
MDTVFKELKKLSSFTLSLPDDDIGYYKILGLTQSVSMKSGLVCLQPGENVGSHNTCEHEELIIVLSGIGEVEIEGFGRKPVIENSVTYIPPDTQHNVYNANHKPLRYIYVASGVSEKV